MISFYNLNKTNKVTFKFYSLNETINSKFLGSLPIQRRFTLVSKFTQTTFFKESNKPYNTVGLTTDQLIALIDKKTQEDCLPKKIKSLNQEQKAFAIDKAIKAHKKMVENQEKQKATFEKNKKDKKL